MTAPELLEVSWTDPSGACHTVGTLTSVGSAAIQSFTYDPSWLAEGFAIGEDLPLQPGPLAPPGGASTFGTFDDAGPDAWGRHVISRTRPLADVSTALGVLAAVADDSRQGALRLREPGGPWLTPGEVSPVGEVHTLVADTQAFARGEADRAALQRLYLGSSSQGGARPKSALRRKDGTLLLAKFPAETDSYDVLTCEAVALSVAQQAGLAVPPFRLVRLDEGRAVLLLERFDRSPHAAATPTTAPASADAQDGRTVRQGRLGYQSMRTASLLGPMESMTYQTAADTARFLAGEAAVLGVVGAAALAICVHNIDDHARNLGFLHDGTGWRLAPLFDVVPYPDEQTGTPLDGHHAERSLELLLDLDWGVPRDAVATVAGRVAAVARGAWTRIAPSLGMDPEIAALCHEVVEEYCDFDTLLDGTEPRLS